MWDISFPASVMRVIDSSAPSSGVPDMARPDPEPRFVCTQCGACCRRAFKMGLPLQPDMQTCVHLDADNRCIIFDTRPWVCRVDEVFKTKGHAYPDRMAFYRAVAERCNAMMREDGLDASFLIDIPAVYRSSE